MNAVLASTPIAEATAKSEQLIAWIDNCFGDNGLPVKDDKRARMAVGCLRLAFQHHRAIVLLVNNSFIGSALALLRSLDESYVRGAWLAFCAPDEDLDRFGRENLDKSFGRMIADLEKLDAFNEGILSVAKTASWKTLNSFTHTGWQQVARQNTADAIDDDYREEDALLALARSGSLAILSMVALASVVGNERIAIEALEKSKTFDNVEAQSGTLGA